MRFVTYSFALLCVLAGTLAAHATDITYYIQGGTMSPVNTDGNPTPDPTADTFSGYITINSSTGLIDGGLIDSKIDGIDYANQVWDPTSDRTVAGGSYANFLNGL